MYNNSTTKTIAKKRYYFKKGYLQVSLADKDALKSELIAILGNPSVSYFSTKLNKGIVNIPHPLFMSINELFERYGITDVWDIADDSL